MIRNWKQSPLFILIPYLKIFSSKILRLTIDSAVSSASQGTLKYFMYFPWPLFQA